ncbi:MAG: Type 1 glutamine amidotransferase-like domain-containing protein [Actinomycetota bacterium]
MELTSAFPVLPKGSGPVGLLSSDEVLPVAIPFDRAMLDASRGARIGVIVAAQGHGGAAQSARMAMRHYESLKAKPFIIDIIDREEAETYVLPDCDIVFMTGGSPRRLLRCLRDTPFWSEAITRWKEGMTLAGSSAGAMALCEHCLVPTPGDYAPTQWTQGLGPLTNVGLAVHASSRDETWIKSIRDSADWPVVALDDATGVILQSQTQPIIAGSGSVRVL